MTLTKVLEANAKTEAAEKIAALQLSAKAEQEDLKAAADGQTSGRYLVTKTYGHDRGFSCAFRQHRANSHCSFLHGYSIGFSLTFERGRLDENGWVLDFGALKPLERHLRSHFDHKTLIASDDPCLAQFRELHKLKGCDLVEMPAVGCEAFAKFVFDETVSFLGRSTANVINPTARIVEVKVMEHGSNAAIYRQ